MGALRAAGRRPAREIDRLLRKVDGALDALRRAAGDLVAQRVVLADAVLVEGNSGQTARGGGDKIDLGAAGDVGGRHRAASVGGMRYVRMIVVPLLAFSVALLAIFNCA